MLPATEDCRLSDAHQERLQYGDYDARWWPNVVFPHEDRVRFDSRFGLCPCKISLEIAEKYNLETPPDIRPHKSNSVHIARFGVYNSPPDRAFLLRFALTADGNVSILFKNHSLAPAYPAIVAGRPLAISLIKFAEIEYGMEAKNWGIPRRDLMRRFLTRFALLRPGLGAMIGLSDGHKRPTI